MSEMIERVAKALAKADGDPSVLFDYYLEHARAAIEAMREPTEEMSKAGFVVNKFDNEIRCCDSPRRLARITMPADPAWKAMIDAALE